MGRTKSTPKQSLTYGSGEGFHAPGPAKPSFYSTSDSNQAAPVPKTLTQPRQAPHQSIIAVLAWAQTHGIEVLPLTWLPHLDGIGFGGTSEISQSLVNAGLGFAFKRLNRERYSGYSAWKAVMAELCISSQSPIRDHPNILRPQGICFEVTPGDTPSVLPVLVFEKAKYGSLKDFMDLPRVGALSFDQRLDLIHEIVSAIGLLHSCLIIHGDIKPENILVSEIDGRLTAQVCDFGFSSICSSESTFPNVRIPQTKPWHAPEHTYAPMTFSEARKTDVYSLALTILWLLFHECVSGDSILQVPVGERCDQDMEQMHPWDWAPSVDAWKRSNKMGQLTRALFRMRCNETDLDHEFARRLCERLSAMLELSPDDRDPSLDRLLCLLRERKHIPGDSIKPSQNLIGADSHQVLNMTRILPSLVDCHFQVRCEVYRALRDELGSTCEKCQKDAAYQLAICTCIGFGAKPKPEAAPELLTKSGKTEHQLQEDLNYIRHTGETMSHTDKRVSALWDTGHLTLTHPGGQRGYYATPSRDRLVQEKNSRLQEIQWAIEGGFSPNHGHVLALQMALISIHIGLDELNQASSLARLIADEHMMDPRHGPTNPRTWMHISALANIEYQQGNYTAAVDHQRQVLKNLVNLVGEKSVLSLSAMADLSLFLSRHQSTLPEASTLLIRALAGIRAVLGEDHPSTLSLSNDMASLLFQRRDLAQAEALFQRVLDAKTNLLGVGNQSTLATMGNLAVVARHKGDLAQAEELTRRTLAIREDLLPADSPDILTNLGNLATVLQMRGDLPGACELATKCLDVSRRTLGHDHPDTYVAMHNLASILHKQGDFDAALDMYVACCRAKERHPGLGPMHSSTMSTVVSKGVLYADMGRFEDARGCFLRGLEALEGRSGLEEDVRDMLALDLVERVVEVYEALGKREEAEGLRRRGLEIQERLALRREGMDSEVLVTE